jgi:hypothetical protein
MSALLGGVFILFLLILGYAFQAWSLVGVILTLTLGIAGILSFTQVEEVKGNWKMRRCDLDVMIAAQLYKPGDDPRSGGEFATDNFSFCMRSLFESIVAALLTPIYNILGKQLDVAKIIEESINTLRGFQSIFINAFMNILEPFLKRFGHVATQFGLTFERLLTAINRVGGIAVSSLYMGMSLTIGIENFVAFIVKVVMIILYIILGLMILIFPLILPVFGLIIFTCQMIGNSPFGYMVGDTCGELCFNPATPIRLASGKLMSMKDLAVGDLLEDEGRVEGVLHVNGLKEPMFHLHGVHVSGAHLVWYQNEWISVAEHPEAVPSSRRCDTLICLRTSTRNIVLRGLEDQEIVFRDWEELPADLPSADSIWETLVSSLLNNKPSTDVPNEHPMLHGHCEVLLRTGERIPLQGVRIGDELYSNNGFTRVVGVYTGEATYAGWGTDGLWVQHIGEKEWNHPPLLPGPLQPGYHLLTESGCFWIQTKEFSGFVRDFTEVGAENLFLTYSYTRKLLKKSFSREESCVSDSLSQVLLSSLQPIY